MDPAASAQAEMDKHFNASFNVTINMDEGLLQLLQRPYEFLDVPIDDWNARSAAYTNEMKNICDVQIIIESFWRKYPLPPRHLVDKRNIETKFAIQINDVGKKHKLVFYVLRLAELMKLMPVYGESGLFQVDKEEIFVNSPFLHWNEQKYATEKMDERSLYTMYINDVLFNFENFIKIGRRDLLNYSPDINHKNCFMYYLVDKYGINPHN